jgi:hypothetical protein
MSRAVRQSGAALRSPPSPDGPLCDGPGSHPHERCGRPVFRGLRCQSHYRQAKAREPLRPIARHPPRALKPGPTTCTGPGLAGPCGRGVRHKRLGLCASHLRQLSGANGKRAALRPLRDSAERNPSGARAWGITWSSTEIPAQLAVLALDAGTSVQQWIRDTVEGVVHRLERDSST